MSLRMCPTRRYRRTSSSEAWQRFPLRQIWSRRYRPPPNDRAIQSPESPRLSARRTIQWSRKVPAVRSRSRPLQFVSDSPPSDDSRRRQSDWAPDGTRSDPVANTPARETPARPLLPRLALTCAEERWASAGSKCNSPDTELWRIRPSLQVPPPWLLPLISP